MSLSILAHMNPICTATRDFVQTDYLALDNKQKGSECMHVPVCHCSPIQWINLHNVFRRCVNKEQENSIFTYKVNCFLMLHAVIFAPQLNKRLLNPEQKSFLLILCFWTNNCIRLPNASGMEGRQKDREEGEPHQYNWGYKSIQLKKKASAVLVMSRSDFPSAADT